MSSEQLFRGACAESGVDPDEAMFVFKDTSGNILEIMFLDPVLGYVVGRNKTVVVFHIPKELEDKYAAKHLRIVEEL